LAEVMQPSLTTRLRPGKTCLWVRKISPRRAAIQAAWPPCGPHRDTESWPPQRTF
jgi:hypothetical protein